MSDTLLEAFSREPLYTWYGVNDYGVWTKYRLYRPEFKKAGNEQHKWLLTVGIQLSRTLIVEVIDFYTGMKILNRALEMAVLPRKAVSSLTPAATVRLQRFLTRGKWAKRWDSNAVEARRDWTAVEVAYKRAGLALQPRKSASGCRL